MKPRIVKNPRTDVDVDRLMTVFADVLPDGRHIAHEQIEAALSLSRAQSRYHTVVNKWRKIMLAERAVWLDGRSAEGAGFVALTPDEMIRYGNRGVRSAGRKVARMMAIVSAPRDEQLSDAMKHYRNLLQAAIEKIARENQSSLRSITKAMAPMKQLPRAAAG